jgi:hypothetical protein
MGLDAWMILSSAAASLALLSILAQWRFRARNRRDLAELRASAQRQADLFEEMQNEMKDSMAALEEAVRNAPEPPRPGALNKSERTQALQLLRSGVSTDVAASTLGLGKREVRLLERVAQTLYVR